MKTRTVMRKILLALIAILTFCFLPTVKAQTIKGSFLNKRQQGKQLFLYRTEGNYKYKIDSVKINIDVKQSGKHSAVIYNMKGESIRFWSKKLFEEGHHVYQWNGLDQKGIEVTSGVYFFQINSNESSQNKKMILVR